MAVNIHESQPVLRLGAKPAEAQLAVILLHGRGSTAESMRSLAEALDIGGVAFLIPQAAQNRWYPHSAFGPIEANQPDLSSALALVDTLVGELYEQGMQDARIVFGGFSQGACLASEYVARHAKTYGGLFIFSGALIGPKDAPRDYPGAFESMPVFMGSSDADPWVSLDLLEDTARVLERMGAAVDFRTYSDIPHTIIQDEIDAVRDLLEGVKA